MENKEFKTKDKSETYDKLLNLVLDILLRDRTTGNNIIWATDNYEKDYGHKPTDIIKKEDITGDYEGLIKPRLLKSKTEQQRRTKEKAEVFTPSWVCCIQNNYFDEQRFGKDVFAKVDYKNKTWKTIDKTIPFPTKEKETWEDYIKSNVIEACCGEAPYLVSPFDVVSGEIIPLENRIGLLDRKFRVIKENYMTKVISSDYHPNKKEQWKGWAKEALKHTYGYEWSGDNLLLARENVYFTVIDYYREQFNEDPDNDFLKEIAEIISWNLWQMDGLKFVVPLSCKDIEKPKPFKKLFATTLDNIEKLPCPGCEEPNFIKGITKTTDDKRNNRKDIQGHSGIYCKVKNWDLEPEGHVIYFGQCLNTTTEELTKQEKIKEYNKPKKVEEIKMGKLFERIGK